MIFTYHEAYELEKKLKPFLENVTKKVDEFIKKHRLYEPTEEYIKEVDPELYELAKERAKGGKKVRPAFIFAVAKAVCKMKDVAYEKIDPKLLPYAVRRECVHAGYLDIDDMQDHSRMRRNRPATWTIVGPERAVNVGLLNSDPIADEARNLSWYEPYKLDENTRRVVDEIDSLIGKMTVEGQDLDIKFRASRKITPELVEKIYRRKTGAYTIGGPMAIGAAISGLDKDLCMKLFDVGTKYIGPAFQARDDILNLVPLLDVPDYGKEWADDLEEGKPTMIVAYFNQEANEEDKLKFYKYFGKGELNKKEKEEAIKLLDKYKCRERTEEYALHKLRDGLKIIENIIPRKHGEELYALLEFTVKRNR